MIMGALEVCWRHLCNLLTGVSFEMITGKGVGARINILGFMKVDEGMC